ncbi:MAG TPA: hypothetical protein VFU07_10315 [Candidatus Lumbricidophila sp.]|nr:hypothetical protein [Candidatus Lumbricidophila sp.]
MSNRIILFVCTAVVAAFAFSPVPASAAEPEVSPACTVGGVAVAEGQPLPKQLPTVISCFESVEAAEQFIEAGAPGDFEQVVQASPGVSATLAAASTVTVGKAWTSTSRSGSVLIHWGVGSGCYGVTYGFPTLPSGWDNNVRSAEGLSNCWASHYDLTNYGGDVLTCAPYCSTLGFMAARSSSIVYRPVGTFG